MTYEAILIDERPAQLIAIENITMGDIFIYRHQLMMKTSSDFGKYKDDIHYGAVIQSPDNKETGRIWMFTPDTLVEPVNVNAEFTIIS